MANRPYAQKSVFDLEIIFDRSRNKANELDRLSTELSFRNTAKARDLAMKVDIALAALAQGNVVPMVASSASGVAAPRMPAHPVAVAPVTPSPKVVPIRQNPRAPATPQTESASELIDLGSLTSFEPSGNKNDAQAILAAWTALEALSPRSYKRPEDMAAGDRSRVALLERGIPWGPEARSKPNYKLYFEVVLGAVALDKATDELVKVFGEDEERSGPDGSKAAIGSILIDKGGHVLEENGVAVSSFAWALKPALDLKLGSLGAWPKVEQKILEKLDQIVRRHDGDGNSIPLDLDVIQRAHRWLVSQFEVPSHLVEPPTFAFKVFHPFKSKTAPEPSLLNSFYLDDLASASELFREGRAGLRRYMGKQVPSNAGTFYRCRRR